MSLRRRRPARDPERERIGRGKLGRAQAEWNKAWEEAWCFAAEFDQPHCADKIIRAHSVQRSGVLDRIAENGHVLSWQDDPRGEDGPDLREIGIHKASTFRGFCEKHDNDIFGPLDRFAFSGTPEQSFLLFLRALTHESHHTHAAIRAALAYEDAMSSVEVGNHWGATLFRRHREQYSVNLEEMAEDRSLAWKMLAARSYETVGVISYLIDRVPEIVACGWVTAHHDFQGREIQDFRSNPLVGTACFILPTETGGIVGLAWLKRSAAAAALFESAMLLDPATAPHDILRFALTYSGNCYVSPVFWRSLDDRAQLWIRSHLAFQPPGVPGIDVLRRVRVVPWIGTNRFFRAPSNAAGTS